MKVIRRRKIGNQTGCLIEGLECFYCKKPLPLLWFCKGEPTTALCSQCLQAEERNERCSFLAVEYSAWKEYPIRWCAAELGYSTGRPRKSLASMGSGENGNGCWDNLIKAYEDDGAAGP